MNDWEDVMLTFKKLRQQFGQNVYVQLDPEEYQRLAWVLFNLEERPYSHLVVFQVPPEIKLFGITITPLKEIK